MHLFKGALVSIASVCENVSHTHKFTNHAHDLPDNKELNGRAMHFKLNTTVSVMTHWCHLAVEHQRLMEQRWWALLG